MGHRSLAGICTGLALCALVGCSDDTGTPEPEPFSITFTVTDTLGLPVAGLRAGLSPALPESLVTIHPPSPAVRDLPGPGNIWTCTVRDVAGREIWARCDTLSDIGIPLIWDGRDQDGHVVHDGWYEFEKLVQDSDLVTIDHAVTPTFFYAGADPDVYLAGVTDATGSFTITDRTFVPAFYDPAPVQPIGDDTAPFAPTPETWLRLRAADGAELWWVFEARDEPQTVSVRWAPERSGP